MPYVKKYIGHEPTGKMLEIKYGEEVSQHYPETKPAYEVVWETPWQPEHAPIGSVVRYETSGQPGPNEVTVTGHYWNGPQSWVILTNDPCPILGGDNKASFNGQWLREIVSRGDGGVFFRNDIDHRQWTVDEYKRGLASIPTTFKGRHQYAGTNPATIVGYVLNTHPAFAYVGGQDMHIHAYTDELAALVINLFESKDMGRYYDGVRVSKRKLVTALKRLLPHHRINRTFLQKQSDELDSAMMDDVFDD